MIEIPDHLTLDDREARVLGALMEKRRTTPDVYPMTLKAVTTACNQSTSRDPVVEFSEQLVDDTLGTLKAKGLVRMVHPGAGERSTKFRHVADEALALDDPATAVLCVLLLRGPQTAAELKTRTERIHRFADTGAAEAALQALASHERHLAVQLERLPGHKERRWQQLLTAQDPHDGPPPIARAYLQDPRDIPDTPDEPDAQASDNDLATRVASLERRLDELVTIVSDLLDTSTAPNAGQANDSATWD